MSKQRTVLALFPILYGLHSLNEFSESPMYWRCQTLPPQSCLLENSPCPAPSRGRTIIHSLLSQSWTTAQIWTKQILSLGIFGINILVDGVNKLLEFKLKGPSDSDQRPPFGKHHQGLGMGPYMSRGSQSVVRCKWSGWAERSRHGGSYGLWGGTWGGLWNPDDFPIPAPGPGDMLGGVPIFFQQTPLIWASLSAFLSLVTEVSFLWPSACFTCLHIYFMAMPLYTNFPRRLLRTRTRKEESQERNQYILTT